VAWNKWLTEFQSLNTNQTKSNEKSAQTLNAGCSKAEPQISTPPQTPFPGAREGQNLISWRRSLPLPTDPVWWGSIYAISSYHANRPTNKHSHKPTHRQDRLQYTAPPQLARSVINSIGLYVAIMPIYTFSAEHRNSNSCM